MSIEPTTREREQARVIVGRIVTAFGNKIQGGDAQAREDAEWVVAGFPWAFQGSTAAHGGDDLRVVTVTVCGRCLAGHGGECHTPGCDFWMTDAPINGVATTLFMHAVSAPDGTTDHA